MNDKFIQLIDRLWNLKPTVVTKNTIAWQYKDSTIELTKYDELHNEKFHVYISKSHKCIMSNSIDVPEAKYLVWKLNLIKAFDNFSNTLLDTLLEEDDASCFDDLLETNKNE